MLTIRVLNSGIKIINFSEVYMHMVFPYLAVKYCQLLAAV